MIVVKLFCPHQHHFEGWFASTIALREQQTNGLLTCPQCNAGDVRELGAEDAAESPSNAPAPTQTAEASQHPLELLGVEELAKVIMGKLQEAISESTDPQEGFTVEVRRVALNEEQMAQIQTIDSQEALETLLEEAAAEATVADDKKQNWH